MSEENNYYAKAQQQAEERNYSKAVEMYNLAIEANPDNPYIYSDRGVAYFHLGKKNLALMDMEKAVVLQPNNPYRYSSRAYIKGYCDDIEGAIADYKKAIQLDPQDAVAYNNLGLMEEKLGQIQSAKVNFKKADELADKMGMKIHEFEEEATGEIVEERTETKSPESSAIIKESLKVFYKKESFKEFVKFVKNGFK